MNHAWVNTSNTNTIESNILNKSFLMGMAFKSVYGQYKYEHQVIAQAEEKITLD